MPAVLKSVTKEDGVMHENEIEKLLIECLRNLQYNCVESGSTHEGFEQYANKSYELVERSSYSEVLLKSELIQSLVRINPYIPFECIEQVVRKLEELSPDDLMPSNSQFHTYLTKGVEVEYHKDGYTKGDIVWLVDYDKLKNNEFMVVNQFTVIENNQNRRPDVVIFINGIPLIVVELKNPADKDATIRKAYNQLQNYKKSIPSLFVYNAFMIISDGLEARYGSLSAGINRFMVWKTGDGKNEASQYVNQLETLTTGLLNKPTLLEYIKYFIVFEKVSKEDSEGHITIEIEKKIAAYHQYYAVKKAEESTIKASRRDGDKKAGVIWHTQGSGKSLSMLFYAGKLVVSHAMRNPTILLLTDRNDLDDQLFTTFSSSINLLGQEPTQANNRVELQDLLNTGSGGVIFTTIQKFFPKDGATIYPLISDRDNIVIIADEAHRSQYGFKARTVNIKDKEGNVVGKNIAYGFAKYIRDALPNATFIGFSGTPIELEDRNTKNVFGDYIDVYDIEDAVTDKATVPIYYESRLAKVELTEEGKELIHNIDEELSELALENSTGFRRLEMIVGAEPRLRTVAKDLVEHYEEREKAFNGKAMIVTMSRNIASDLYDQIREFRPQWFHKDWDKGRVKVVFSANSSDEEKLARFQLTRQQLKDTSAKFKNPESEFKIVIVVDMWLTGFDVPCLHTMYIDKPLKGHTLMQAIARVNRVYLDKPGGLVVDYLGIASELKKALQTYRRSGGQGAPTLDTNQAIAMMLKYYEIVQGIYDKFDYKAFFKADTGRKLDIILEAEDYILSLEEGKQRYMDAVTSLSKAFSLVVTSDEAKQIRDEVAFFQAVKARLSKFDGPEGPGGDSTELLAALKQVIDSAVVTDKVIDIFDAAGIKKPDISILSDEFLDEVKRMKNRNLAFELLKKLIGDEIKAQSRKNIAMGKKLAEMLEEAIRNYQSNVITSAQVIQELIDQAKYIRNITSRGEDMGLTDEELAFYDALAQNESAKEVLGNDKLIELATLIVLRIKDNITIDWDKKENVRSQMRVIVKRLLRKYGYPPDKQAIATETVLEQAKAIIKFEMNR